MKEEKTGTAFEDNRIIYMSGQFDEAKAKEIITQLFTFECKSPKKDILMFIDSYGGYVHSFLAIHDVLQLLRCPVATLCVGKAMSCGQMLLISGAKGKRFITPNSRVLVHEVSSGTFGKLKDMENDIEETKKLKVILDNLILKYTKISSKQLKEFMTKDTFLSASDCIKYGIVDNMVNSPKDLYSRINL